MVVHRFSKNTMEEIRICVNEYLGHRFIDLRLYFKDGQGEFNPTKKGVTFSPKLVSELETAVDKLKREI